MKKQITRSFFFIFAFLCILPNIPAIKWHALPAWAGLLGGVITALVLGNPFLAQTRVITPKLLSWSVIGLGAAMNLKTVAVVGLKGFGYTFIGIIVTLTVGMLIGRVLGISKKASILVSAGTAICGGSAIAAVSSAICAKEEETSLSLATVFLLNAAALLIFPAIGHMLNMSEHAFGLWAALGIHDTSSVVGASVGYGKEALTVATTTKLARALWIIPVTFAFGIWIARQEKHEPGKNKAKKPWFILGFLLAAALVTYLPSLQPAGHFVSEAAKRSLVLTLFFIGLGLNRASIAKVGLKPFLQGILLWIIAGGGTLAAIMLGWIR